MMGGSPTSMKDVRWHLGHLDSLRGIAVLGVVMVHAGLNLNLPHRLAYITNSGQRGVQLFFIVSAFTLFMSHDNRKDEHRPNLNFFLRRLFRLFPMFYVATAVACIFTPQYVGPRIDVLLSLLFLHGFTPRTIMHGALGGWSVATEAIFYMCLPLLFRIIRSLYAAIWFLFISVPVMYYVSGALTARFPQSDYFDFLGFPVEIRCSRLGSPLTLYGRSTSPHRISHRHQTTRNFRCCSSAWPLCCIGLIFRSHIGTFTYARWSERFC
jgi:peptidoglycan/LPS O-acetylase OafA/YrhL